MSDIGAKRPPNWKPYGWPEPNEYARVRTPAPRAAVECEECGFQFRQNVWNQRFCCRKHQQRNRERRRREDPVKRAYKNQHARLYQVMIRARAGTYLGKVAA